MQISVAKSNSLSYLLSFLILFSSSFGFAQEIAPEYSFFNPSQADEFDSPELIKGEYFSDYNTFQRPLSDPAMRWTLKNHYDLILGSVSGKEFIEKQKIFFSGHLSKDLEVRFLWFRDHDLEQGFSQATIELIYWWNHWGLAVNGFPSAAKSDNDLGFALLNRSFLGGESRIFVHFPDFQRNSRNKENDRWQDSPLVMGFASRSSDHELVLRHEKQLSWFLPDEGRLYHFKRTIVQAKKWFKLTEDKSLALAFFYENKYEGQDPLPGNTAITSDSLRRERVSTQIEYEQSIHSHQLLVGLAHHYRDYQKHESDFRLHNWLPYVWWGRAWQGPETFQRRWKFGIDTAIFDASNEPLFLGEDVARGIHTFRIDSRFNTVYEMRSQGRWSLNLLFTFDIDMYKSDGLWEGGAGQFRFYF